MLPSEQHLVRIEAKPLAHAGCNRLMDELHVQWLERVASEVDRLAAGEQAALQDEPENLELGAAPPVESRRRSAVSVGREEGREGSRSSWAERG